MNRCELLSSLAGAVAGAGLPEMTATPVGGEPMPHVIFLTPPLELDLCPESVDRLKKELEALYLGAKPVKFVLLPPGVQVVPMVWEKFDDYEILRVGTVTPNEARQ